jgi:sodium/pantothenate symporter
MFNLLAQAAAAPTSAPDAPGIGALLALVLFIAASVWLGTVAQRVVERSRFIQGYFQGNRGLGAWTIALTATVQSGGTFMGFPSLVYSSGWIVALWIASSRNSKPGPW